MRTLFPALAFVVLAAGCSSPDRADTIGSAPTSAAAARRPAPAARPPATKAQLQSALPTIREMPTGFAVNTAENSNDDVVDQPACRTLFDGLEQRAATTPVAKAGVSYVGGGTFGATLAADASSYRDAAVLTRSIQDMAAAFDRCGTYTSHSRKNGTTSAGRVTALSFPKLGDQTFAARFRVTSQGFEVSADLVLVRVGRCSASVIYGGIVATDYALLERSARSITQRLGKVC